MAKGGSLEGSKMRAAALMMALSSAQAIDAKAAQQDGYQDTYAETAPEILNSPSGGLGKSYTQARQEEEGKGPYLTSPEAEQEAIRTRELEMRKHQERFTGTSVLPVEGGSQSTPQKSTRETVPSAAQEGQGQEEMSTDSSATEAEQAQTLLAEQARAQLQKQQAIQESEAETAASGVESAKQQKRQLKNLRQMADVFGSEGVIPFFDLVVQRNKDMFEYYFFRKETTPDISIGQLFITLWLDLALLLAPIFQLVVFLIPLTPLILLAAGIAWLTS